MADVPAGDADEEQARTCSRCGDGATGPRGGMPEGWSVASERGGVAFLCATCTRASVRGIEGRLDEEWW